MAKEKIVYTIKGSEDGVYAVCSNKQKAFEKAMGYFVGSWSEGQPITIEDKKANQLNFNEYINKHYRCEINQDSLTVEVESYVINK